MRRKFNVMAPSGRLSHKLKSGFNRVFTATETNNLEFFLISKTRYVTFCQGNLVDSLVDQTIILSRPAFL